MANSKFFQGGKSKAVKGLSRVDARLVEYADKLLFAGDKKGEFGFDMDAVQELLATWAEDDAHDAALEAEPAGPSIVEQMCVPDSEVDSEEEELPAAPVNLFGNIAATLANAPAAPAAQAVAQRAASRGAYQIEKDRPSQNGIKRPSAGGLCRAVWDEMDHLRDSQQGAIPSAAQVKEAAKGKEWNENNAMIEFYQWRKFNGIVGRAKKVVAVVDVAE